MIERRNKFPDIPRLDQEIDYLLKEIEALNGKIVDVLPSLSSTKEFQKFLIKQTDGTYKTYMKIGNDFMIQKTDGTNLFWEKT
jgi:hypothetical protein